MTVKAVFFDMGGTIENFWHTRELRLKATPEIQKRLELAGIHLPVDNEQLYELVSTGLNRYHQWRFDCLEELPPQRVWREFIFKDFSLEPGSIERVAEDLMVIVETQYYQREMRPEIPVVLNALHEMGLKIGIISNVCSRGQVPYSLKRYQIRHYFNPIILSSEYGRRKPDPAIFHYAARMAKAPTSGCVHVGDRINRDILGAQRAGYRLAIQIRHQYQDKGEEDEGAQPDAVLENMMELLDVLQAEQNQPVAFPVKKLAARKVRAILFDAGDILYYRPQSGRKLNAFLQSLALPDIDHHEQDKISISNRAYQGQIDRDSYREDILKLYGVTHPEDIERGKKILDFDDNHIRFFPGVRQTLLALKEQGFLLGIITDTITPVHVKLNWFERGGFGHVWDAIISSYELGIRKPDPQIYQAALQQLGLAASQAVFVGHKATELDGARAVGMNTIAFNYEDAAQADFYIKAFKDLLNVPILTSQDRQQVNI